MLKKEHLSSAIRKIVCYALVTVLLLQPNMSMAKNQDTQDEVTKLVSDYMNVREALVEGKRREWEEIIVTPMYQDELLRMEKMRELGIYNVDSSFEVIEKNISDDEVQVILTESVKYDNQKMHEVYHEIVIMEKNDGTYLVVSDGYNDTAIGYTSCSYVNHENNGISTCATTASSACITNIAIKEIGYLEKKSDSNLNDKTANAGSGDYTKYGKWIGENPAKWCHIFVSWCANKAKIGTGIIPKTSSCDVGMQKFKNWGKFKKSKAYGGSYTPKAGDIIYTGPNETDASHTGIVESVANGKVNIIDGNSSNKVKRSTYSLSGSSILGYGVPKYTSGLHNWVASGSQYKCSNCGAKTSSIPSAS